MVVVTKGIHMVTKEQAHAVKTKLQTTWPELSFGLTKDGDDYAIAARGKDYEALAELPPIVEGVKVQKDTPGPITAL